MSTRNSDALWDDTRLAAPHEQVDKSWRVRRMFDAIAPTYERVNRVFSGGRDRAWRKRAVALADATRSDRVLDVACGTGDMVRTFLLHAERPGLVVGCDFSAKMLALATEDSVGPAGKPLRREARESTSGKDGPRPEWVQADALTLPFAAGSFTIATCAFGARNFENLDRGFGEMARILRPGGRAVVLEFSRPSNRLFRAAYEFYARRVMPLGASWLSRDVTGAYRYLPQSVLSFPDSMEMCRRLEQAGFRGVRPIPLTFGIVTLYLAIRTDDHSSDQCRNSPP